MKQQRQRSSPSGCGQHGRKHQPLYVGKVNLGHFRLPIVFSGAPRVSSHASTPRGISDASGDSGVVC